MKEGHPLARYGYPAVEAEDPLDCPGCEGLYDARFWGNAAVSFMRRDETYRHDAGLMCPNRKRLFDVDRLMRYQGYTEAEYALETRRALGAGRATGRSREGG